MTHVCRFFLNRPKSSYRPLACKPLILESKTLNSTGRENYAEVFFTLKSNTLREKATLDLILPIPFWLKQSGREAVPEFPDNVRVTDSGDIRIIDLGLVRVIN